MSLTIEEIRTKKVNLENFIGRFLNEQIKSFQSDTGLMIDEIQIELGPFHTVDEQSLRPIKEVRLYLDWEG